jgi:hypothetical protein
MTAIVRERLLICGASGFLCGILLQASWAQNNGPYQEKPDKDDRVGDSRARVRLVEERYIDADREVVRNTFVPFSADPNFRDPRAVAVNAAAEIRKAAEALRDAKDEEAKDKAKEHLRELLRNYFGEDMVRREKELEAMENRLKKLKEQLARRRDKMNEILDLQVKVLVNEADGLGFFSSGPSSESQPTRNSYWYYGSPRSNAVTPPPEAPVPSRIIAAPTGQPTDPTPPAETIEPPLEPVQTTPIQSR